MKTFKTIDLRISIILITLFPVISLVKQDFFYIITGYFTVGSWQIISMLIHAMNNWFIVKGSNRVIYHRIVLGILITALVGSIFNNILFALLVALLFLSPILAIYYTWLCHYELKVKMKRPIFLLK